MTPECSHCLFRALCPGESVKSVLKSGFRVNPGPSGQHEQEEVARRQEEEEERDDSTPRVT